MDAHGIVDFKEAASDPVLWVLGLVVQGAVAVTLGLLFAAIGISQIGNAIVWALVIGIGLVFLEMVASNRTIKKPFALSLYSGGGRVIQFVVMGIILTAWQ